MLNRVFALLFLIILFPPLLLLFIFATIDTKNSGLFLHQRVGLHGKPFMLYKLRTLKGKFDTSVTNPQMQRSELGNFLRKYHIDEWPQLLNIVLGDMNFVGPRPDTVKTYDLLDSETYSILTSIKPGLTGLAQLEFFNEEELLAQQENPEQYYYEVLWPQKVQQSITYIQNKNLKSEIKIIFDTLKKLF